MGRCGNRLPSKPYQQLWKSIIINRKLPFSAHCFEVTTEALACILLTVGFGEYGDTWQDVGRYWERLLKKISDQFCQSIFSEDSFSLFSLLFWSNNKKQLHAFYQLWELGDVGKCWRRWKGVGIAPSKPYDQVLKSIITKHKLPFSAHDFEETIKSISTCSTNCGLWGIWRNVARCGEIWGTFFSKS